MGMPSTFSSCTKTDRPLALWPLTTVRTFISSLLYPSRTWASLSAIALEDAKRIYVLAVDVPCFVVRQTSEIVQRNGRWMHERGSVERPTEEHAGGGPMGLSPREAA